ncbi:MAG: PAS domain-containing protein [Bacteroidota bacterium]|nr:PAS domain-containing protein [Bacteroidota bacterium]
MDNHKETRGKNISVDEQTTHLQTFFQYSKQAFLLINDDWKIVDSNISCTDLTGYSPEELSGKPVNELVDSNEHSVLTEIIDNLQPGSSSRIECNIITKQKNLKRGILNVTGFSDGFVITIEDISIQYNELQITKLQLDSSQIALLKITDLLNNSRDILYIFNYDQSKFEYLTPSASELFGYSQEEMLDMERGDILRMIHPEYQKTCQQYWLSLKDFNALHSYSLEYKIKPQAGISRWINDSHRLIRDDDGKLIKIIGTIRDITEFKLVEEALDRSRDRFYKAIEATNDGMWDWELNIKKIYFSPRFYSMAGYNTSDFPPSFKEWINLIHPNDLSLALERLNLHLQGKSDQWIIEYRFRTKTGNWMWMLNQGKIFERDSNGTPLRMVGTHSDISQRKKAEEELQNRNKELQEIYNQLQFNEEKFRQLAENTQDVFWLSEKKNILYINSAFEKIWGRDHADVYQNPDILSEWIYPEDKHTFSSWFPFEKFKNHQPLIEYYRIVKPDGEIRWLWSRMFPVHNDNNELYRIAGIASDITEQKRTEKALIAAKEKALESDLLKSAFLANVSHEIRTPMNGIIGFAELLKRPNLSEETRIQFIDTISKSSDQLLHIIDDILDISKIESNQLKLNITTFNLNDLITDLYNFFETDKKNSDKGHIDIIINVPSDLHDAKITTDATRLRQILTNLISNALKFTDEGLVEFGFQMQNNDIELFVKDTGIGIPADQQSQLFKRFRQLDASMTRRFGGTGLGLAICEGLVRLLKGKIWLTSEKDKGSIFYVSIPYITAQESATPDVKDIFLLDEYDWTGKTILVVEDDEINQEFLNVILIPTHATVINASSGEKAVELSYSTPNIDIILMDIRLPNMNGYEAFQKIRQKYPSLPIIAQTAFAMPEDAIYCMELGFSDYISKPINRKAILTKINNQLIIKNEP